MRVRRVLVVDDEDIVRAAYKAFLARTPGFELAGEASDGEAGLASYRDLRPDLVLMDLNMPVLDGVAATRAICAEFPRACVVVLTTFATAPHVVAALRAGASGYLTKDCSRAELLDALGAALAGDMPLSPAIRRELVADAVASSTVDAPGGPAGSPPSAHVAPAASEVNEREREVLVGVARGLTNAQIASRMHVSEGSVKQYLVRLGDKLDAMARTQILIRAIQRGLIDPHALPDD